MATWKKVALEADLSAFAQTDATNNAIPYGNEAGDFDYTNIPSDGQILVTVDADGSNPVPTFVTLDGDASIDNSGSLTIANNAVETGMIADNAVTTGKMAKGAGGGMLVYHDASTVTNTDSTQNYDPVVLPAGTNGQVLKTVVAGGVEYLAWGSASFSNLTVGDGDGVDPGDTGPDPDIAAKLPVLFSNGLGDKVVYGDVGSIPMEYIPNEHLLKVGNITVDSTVTGVSGVFSSGVDKANSVKVTDSDTGSNYLAFFSAEGNDGYQTPSTQSNLQYNAESETLSVKNLVVSGNNTTVNTTTLEVKDKTIVLASSDTDTTAEQSSGAGIVVDVNNQAGTTNALGDESGNDAFCPRLYWTNDGTGATDTNPAQTSVVNNTSSIGWRLADVGTLVSDSPTEVSQGHNIAPTLINQTVVPMSQEIGIGSMWLTHNSTTGSGVPTGALYIQVA